MGFSLEAAIATPLVIGVVLGVTMLAPPELMATVKIKREVEIASLQRINPSHLYHANQGEFNSLVVLQSSAQLMQDVVVLIEDAVRVIGQFGGG